LIDEPPSGEPGRGQSINRPTADRQRPIRVLVVDDEPSICQALSALFGWHGLEVVTVLSAIEARNALTSAQFDVLLVDLRLRDGRGDTLFQEAIEQQPGLRERTIFMTGDITAEAERLIAATNCPFLRKPFDITLAVQAIAALLGISYQPPPDRAPPRRGDSLGSFGDGKAG
jgi:DNA-binding NtrC family response regulator